MKRTLIAGCLCAATLMSALAIGPADATPLVASTTTAARGTATASPTLTESLTEIAWRGGRHHWNGGGWRSGYAFGGFYPAYGLYFNDGPRCWWSHRWHRRVCRYNY